MWKSSSLETEKWIYFFGQAIQKTFADLQGEDVKTLDKVIRKTRESPIFNLNLSLTFKSKIQKKHVYPPAGLE